MSDLEPDLVGALTTAATAAGLAPSIHNTQPWSWRIRRGVADLFADTRRQLQVADASRRLLTISCGAALHHARVCLAAAGVAVEVNLLPAAGDPFHLARVTVTGAVPASDADRGMCDAIPLRHTDRRPLLDEPVAADAVIAMRRLAVDYGAGLHPLDRAQVLSLADATRRAQADEIADSATRRELDSWTGSRRPAGTGVPDANIPEAATRSTVPSRDFGHVGVLPVADQGDSAATYAILYGLDDQPASWLRCGQALSAVWLYATQKGIAVLPLSAPIEELPTRQALHGILGGLGSAHLPLRLGMSDPAFPVPARTPRLPVNVTVTVLA